MSERVALTVSAPCVVWAEDEFAASDYKGSTLQGSGVLSRVVDLSVPHGDYVVNAKVSVRNHDGDSQNAVCQLKVRASNKNDFRVLDDTAVRLGGVDSSTAEQSVALQGAFSTEATSSTAIPTLIVVSCATFDGEARQAVLTALKVDGILTPGPSPYQNPPAGWCGNANDC